jgi:hypothetical protein
MEPFMKSTQLILSDPNLVAEFVRQEEFKAFFEKRLEVPPDYLGLLIRDGQFVEAYKGAHFSVGGIFNQLKGIVGGSHSISVLLADLKTFQVKSDFTAITRDKVEVKGVVAIDLQVNPEKPQNILGMLTGRKALSKEDVAKRIRVTLADRVFEASVGRLDAGDVRGNRGLQDLIQADTMKEIERVLGDLGILIRHSSVEWAINDVEKAEMARAVAVRAAEEAEFQFAQLKREMERQNETTVLQLSTKQALDKLKLQNGSDLERLVMSQEIEFVDARETGKRVQEMKVLQHEIELLRTERLFKFEGEIAIATHAGVDMKLIEERKRRIERDTQVLDKEHDIQLRRLEKQFEHETRSGELDIVKKEDAAAFERRRIEAEVKAREVQSALESQIKADKAALEKLGGLQGLQADQDRQRLQERIQETEMRHKHEMDKARLEAERESTRLRHGATMTPEQTLAVNAGLSPQVAKVLEEQAKAAANSSGNAQAMDLMKQMVAMADRNTTQTAEQAKALAQMIVQSSIGVAGGVGAAKAAGGGGVLGGAGTVDCPKCGRTNEAKDRFCVGCGEQLRK